MSATARVPLSVAAQRLGLTWHATWARLLRGALTGERVGGRWEVDESSIERFIANREEREQHGTDTRPAA